MKYTNPVATNAASSELISYCFVNCVKKKKNTIGF